MNIGESIKGIRKEKDISQKELAEKIGLSANAVNNIENGKSFPGKGTLERIASALHVPMSYVLLYSLEEKDIPQPVREQVMLNVNYIKNLLINTNHETI